VVITTKLQIVLLKFISIRKAKAKEEKVQTHTQVQRSDFRDSAKVKRLKQIGAEMVQDSKRQLEEGLQAARCKGGVRADSVSSLIVAAGERCGLLGVGFENMMRSWVMK